MTALRRAAIAASVAAAAIALSVLALRDADRAGERPAAPVAVWAPASTPVTFAAAAGDPTPDPVVAAPAAPPASAPDPAFARQASRELIEAGLARVLAPEIDAQDRRRLAELMLDTRDALASDEPPGIRREIALRVQEEFARIAGEPMGPVAGRLGQLFTPGAARPPRPLPAAVTAESPR